jgi:hypothetical protein
VHPFVAVDQRHSRFLGGKRTRDRRPDALCRPDDNGHLAMKLKIHDVPPVRCA